MGASDRNVADLGLAARVRDLDAVVRALKLDRFALGGVDIGAVTAVAYAVEYPAAVSHLLPLSPWASGARYFQIPALRAAYSTEAPGEREWRLFADILSSVASGFKDPEAVRRHTEAFLKTTSPQALSAFNAANVGIDIRDLLPRVPKPERETTSSTSDSHVFSRRDSRSHSSRTRVTKVRSLRTGLSGSANSTCRP